MQANCSYDPMKSAPLSGLLFALLSSTGAVLPASESGEEVFEYHVDRVDWLSGEGVDLGGVLVPTLYLDAAGGLLEPGAAAGDLASSGHDPLNEWGIQAIELHLDFEFSDTLRGLVSGFGHQGADHLWEAELEEAKLLWRAGERLTVGGGQFLNRFGFQSDLHLHDWFFVNQNLANGRLLNEGELITQGGRLVMHLPKGGSLDFGFGGLRTHSHRHAHGGHGHGEEEEHHHDEHGHGDHDDHEHDHRGEHGHEPFEFDKAGFRGWIASADYRFRLPFDDSVTGSLSLALGENGFGRGTGVYGAGFRKVWNGHDHGHGGPDFCSGAVMLQSELIGRKADARLEDGDPIDFDDYGFSNSIHYGISDAATVSLRHDWISDVEIAGIDDRHRLSAAFTAYLDKSQRVRARLQYDHIRDPDLGSEHAAWLQIQLQWGGIGGSHQGHGH